MKDYYQILGIPRSASLPDIKKAYRNLVKECHPDINHSPKAVEWTRDLNEAYNVLSDAESKISHDINLRRSELKQDAVRPKTPRTYQPRQKRRPGFETQSNYCCERCQKINATLRLSVFWQVYSFLNYSKKSPSVMMLCGPCRVHKSMSASAVTLFFGLWGPLGFFWAIQALFKNAHGGEQPKAENAKILISLGFFFYQNQRYQEAYEAVNSAIKIKYDSEIKEMLNKLKQHFYKNTKKSFWEKLCKFELHPIYYHAPIGAILGGSIILGYIALITDSFTSLPYTPQQRSAIYTPTVKNKPNFIIKHDFLENLAPVIKDQKPNILTNFTDPEQPMPEQGLMKLGLNFRPNTDEKAPLKIITELANGNYVLKIENWNSGEFFASYFIHRGSILNIEVPLGSYKIKLACGKKWYGPIDLFGPDTVYSYIPDKIIFNEYADYYRGYSIDLIPQVGGNLKTRTMQAGDW